MTGIEHLLRQLLFWGLPIAIFFIVFSKVNLELLKANLLQSDLRWIALGLSVYPLMMILGASRWNYQLRLYVSNQAALAQTIKFYWMGFPFTLFVPSGLGWDAHRVLIAGREYGRFELNIGVIIIEKIIALFATLLLIVTAYPLTLSYLLSTSYKHAFNFSILLLLLMLAALGIAALFLKHRFITAVLDQTNTYVSSKIKSIRAKIGVQGRSDSMGNSVHDFLLPMVNPRRSGPILVRSIAIQATSAIAAQFFFTAAGYDIPFAVNLFVVPFIFLALILPISFGGLGVREVAFIVFYGQFGVPAEIALVVSFFTLMGVLLNCTIGGVLLWCHGTNRLL